jgi:hypothetical protein
MYFKNKFTEKALAEKTNGNHIFKDFHPNTKNSFNLLPVRPLKNTIDSSVSNHLKKDSQIYINPVASSRVKKTVANKVLQPS